MASLNRRQFLKSSAALAAGTIPFAGCQNQRAGQVAETAKRPNIIFLLTDDQRWDTIGALGNTIIKTPNMDSLVENGIAFENAFVTSAICMSSRASIFSGQYVYRHGIVDFFTPFTDAAFDKTYPMLLRSAGYRTGYVGKYGVGRNQNPVDKFDVWYGINGQPVYEQLYDLQSDPDEVEDLAKNKKYQKTLKQLRERCIRIFSEYRGNNGTDQYRCHLAAS